LSNSRNGDDVGGFKRDTFYARLVPAQLARAQIGHSPFYGGDGSPRLRNSPGSPPVIVVSKDIGLPVSRNPATDAGAEPISAITLSPK
jgi:hypothetical protein